MSYKPANVPGMIPYLTVKDAEKSLNFYQKAFGFELDSEPKKDENGKIQHVEMKYEDTLLMFAPEGTWGTQAQAPATSSLVSPISLYMYTRDVDAFYKNAVAQGATSMGEPEDMFWGDRCCRLTDPDGYHWCFGTNIKPHK